MDFGIGYFPTHDAVGPGAIALLAEERGFASLFFAEHTHIPASSRDPGGGELPHMYFHTYDLFVALTAAAAATSRLRIGSGICLVTERDQLFIDFNTQFGASYGDMLSWRANYQPGLGEQGADVVRAVDPRRMEALMVRLMANSARRK